MNCEVCKVNKAIIHITEIENGNFREVHICQSCAESGEMSKLGKGTLEPGFGPLPKELTRIKCNFCSSTLIDLSKKRLLGCANDYEIFKKVILPVIEKIHSAKKHKGKKPVSLGDKFHNILQQIKGFEIQLKDAIKKEDYEKAAKVRDKIQELRAQMEKSDKKEI